MADTGLKNENRLIGKVGGDGGLVRPGLSFRNCFYVLAGELSFAVNTRKGSSVLENIRALHGNEIARELLPLDFKDEKISLEYSGSVI